MLRRVGIVLVAAALVVAAAGGLTAWFGWRYVDAYMQAPGPSETERVVSVPRGEGVAAIATRLAEAGVIEDARLFRLGVRLSQRDRELKAGEYAFPAAITPVAVLDLLEAGRTVQRRVTVAEGAQVREVMAALEAADGLTGPLPEPPAQGSLLPETYFFESGEPRAAVLGRMQKAMADTLAELWPQRAENLPFDTPEQAVVLASIVEKETGVAAERPQVASVFVNRMRRGMPLQSDPTVIYALTGGEQELGRPLLRADLTVEHPANTYVVDGLPPTPIANPGRASIEAVLNPAATDFLYFVADGTGGHAFARTLAEHNRNVARWRAVQRSQTPTTGG